MLTVQFDEIKESGLSLEGVVNPDEFSQLNELSESGVSRVAEPVKYKLNLYRLADMVEVDGSLEGVIDLSCSRCLDHYQMPFSSRFSMAFTRHLPEVGGDEEDGVELTADEMGLTLVEDDTIALLEPLQEQILMALPIQPLCMSSCKGLCMHCGGNMNTNDCGCEEPLFDTRFASLKDFKVEK